MKKIGILALVGLVAVALSLPVWAAETAPAANQDQVQSESGAASVSPAQLELVKKREEAKKRRDELLKQREALIQESGGPQPAPAGQ